MDDHIEKLLGLLQILVEVGGYVLVILVLEGGPLFLKIKWSGKNILLGVPASMLLQADDALALVLISKQMF